MAAPPEVLEIVEAHAPNFSLVQEEGKTKIKCKLNGHTFPAKADALEAFVNGKKYAKLVRAAQLDAALAKYEPFIVRSKNEPGMLFCALTGELLNARLHEVKAHLKGKKFDRAKERFQNDQQELLEEPEMEGDDMEEDDAEDGPGLWLPEEVLREYEMVDADEEGEEGEEEEREEEEEEVGQEEQQAAAVAVAPVAASGKGKGKGRKQRQVAAPVVAAEAGEGGKGAGKQRQQKVAAAGGSGKAKKQQKQQQQQQQEKQPNQKKQQQQGMKAAANGAAGGSAGKGKAPKAKRARTG